MIPPLSLNDGTTIPQLGFGTLYLPAEPTPSEPWTGDVVGLALKLGYRHIDTAQSYGTEPGVGVAITKSGLPRSDIYVTSKLGNANHRPDDVRTSFAQTLANLDVDQLDLFLMHWPLPTLYGGDYVSTWRAMTELVDAGRARTIGVSNFEPAHLERIVTETGVVPAVNQIEVHPYFRNDTARRASTERGIAIEAWSPLGRGAVLDDPVIAQVASNHHKTPAQIVLRWHVQHDHIVFPKSARRERMEENFAIFDFELSAVEMADMDALDRGEEGRIGPHPDTFAQVP